MAKSSNREQVTGPVGLTGTQTLSGRVPGGRLRPEFVHPECTTSNCLCGLGAGYVMTRTAAFRGKSPGGVPGPNLCSMDAQTTWDCFVVLSASDKGNEDRQHFDCATWLHKVDHKKSDALRFHRRGPLGLKAQIGRAPCW